jgi:hypothetical protein
MKDEKQNSKVGEIIAVTIGVLFGFAIIGFSIYYEFCKFMFFWKNH